MASWLATVGAVFLLTWLLASLIFCAGFALGAWAANNRRRMETERLERTARRDL
jgi:hypothetical protein